MEMSRRKCYFYALTYLFLDVATGSVIKSYLDNDWFPSWSGGLEQTLKQCDSVSILIRSAALRSEVYDERLEYYNDEELDDIQTRRDNSSHVQMSENREILRRSHNWESCYHACCTAVTDTCAACGCFSKLEKKFKKACKKACKDEF